MRNLIEARAIEYADHLGGATGDAGEGLPRQERQAGDLEVRRGADCEDQRRVEAGGDRRRQWTEKREAKGSVGIIEFMRRLNAGRDRCAAAKRAADEKTKHDATA
jgi:hypothetical protein